MKTNHKSVLLLLLPAIIVIIIGCAKTKDLTADNGLKTSERSVTSSDDYYWYKGNKIPLTKNVSKKYILFEASNEAIVNDVLSKKRIKVKDKPQQLNLAKSTKKLNKKVSKDLKWAIIETSDNLTKESPSILYEAPFFKTFGKQEEIGLSHLFYVKLKSSDDLPFLMQLALENNVEVVGNNENVPLRYTLECSSQSAGNALEMANKFYETKRFATSQPDLMGVFKNACVNDTYFSNQWNLNNTGQHGGTAGLDIKFCNARSITQGVNSVIVAVIDDGVDLTHTDLNIYSSGFDTENGANPSVLRGNHGTACAGISGALANNNSGIAGIASNCPIMPISLQYGYIYPDTYTKYASGYYYAANNGASVLSNSWAGPEVYNEDLDDAITYCLTNGRGGKGCIVVFAAGNDDLSSVSYPANSHPDILVVGAMSYCAERKSPTSCDGESWWGSNYGTALDIMAPGVKIPTLIPGNSHTQTFNGTSSAAPHVAGVAALILSVNPNLTQQQVAAIIEQTTQKAGGYSYSTTGGRPNGTWHNEMGYGLLDAFAAVTAAGSCTTVYYNGQTVNINTNVAGCRIESQNVTVNSGAKLTFTSVEYILFNSNFEVKSGAELEAGF